MGLLWIYTVRALSALIGFTYPKQPHLDFHPPTLPVGTTVSLKLMNEPALSYIVGVPETRPISCCPGLWGSWIDLAPMPCFLPCLLFLLRESLGSPQTWLIISPYLGLLMDPIPLPTLPWCSRAVPSSETALPYLCRTWSQLLGHLLQWTSWALAAPWQTGE